MRTCSDVHNYLEEQGVTHEMLPLPDSSASAERAAELLGVTSREVIKSLLFLVDDVPTLVLVAGDARVDPAALAAALGARRVSLARPEEVLGATGYRVGARAALRSGERPAGRGGPGGVRAAGRLLRRRRGGDDAQDTQRRPEGGCSTRGCWRSRSD